MTLTLDNLEQVVEDLDHRIFCSVEKCTVGLDEVGVLFSAGLDSSLIAKVCEDLGLKAILFMVGLEGSPDLGYVKVAEKALKSPIKVKVITPTDVEIYAGKVIRSIEDYNPLDVSIGIPFFIACEMARDEGISNLLCGQGADELFAGYHRYLSMSKEDLETALCEDIKKAKSSALSRDHVIALANSLSLLTPFLEPDLVNFALEIQVDFKIKDGVRKFVLREVAKKRGLPGSIFNREKKAIQYSTGVDKVIRKIAKRENMDIRTYCYSVYNQVLE